jgi:acyl carrier protein
MYTGEICNLTDFMALSVVKRAMEEDLHIDPSKAVPRATLEDLGLNELDRVELARWLEAAFNVSLVADWDFKGVSDVGGIVTYIRGWVATHCPNK